MRGGYSLTFVNEETVTVGTNFLGMNAGLSSRVDVTGQYALWNSGAAQLPAAPTFKTVRTLTDQMALSATGSMGIIDSNIRLFYNPTAGGVGNLPILAFNAPSVLSVDAALSKRFSILKKYNIEFRGEAFNLFNAVYFYMGDMNVNSATFGRITGTAIGSRVVQLTARFEF